MITARHPFQYLHRTCSDKAKVEYLLSGVSRLSVNAATEINYQVAQLDDYKKLKRGAFPHLSPVSIGLEMRASHSKLPGTWGMGLWNDPFSFSIGFGGGIRKTPVPPNAAWFFFASEPNYLSFQNNLPVNGWLANVFHTPKIPGAVLAPAALGLPLFFYRPAAKLLRKLASKMITQDACTLSYDPAEWQKYRLEWGTSKTEFFVNEQKVFSTQISPNGPLGLVIWIDNQFAAFPPDGRLQFGTLPVPEDQWIEIKNLRIQKR